MIELRTSHVSCNEATDHGSTMSATLRSLAVASCTALMIGSAVTSAGATGASTFVLHPGYGQVGSTLTMTTGATFNGDTGATINGTPAQDFHVVNPNKATAIVPFGATSGQVDVIGAAPMSGPDFTVQFATQSTTALSKSTLTYPHRLVVTGTETVVGTGSPVAHQAAVLQHRRSGSKSWHTASGTKVKKTGPHGNVDWAVQPSANGQFRVAFRGSHSYAKTTSSGQRIRVVPFLHVRPTHTVPQLTTSQIRGSVHPHLTGRVLLQQRINGRWKTVHRTIADAGHYSFNISPSQLGHETYRVTRPHDSTHAGSTSRALRVQVVHRTLTFGNSGPDVRALQQRLRRLHYDVGPVTSDYGWDTVHAVTAFQKVQGISPDGQTGLQVWRRLNHPKVIHLKYPTAGTYTVEVDIAKEVLLLGHDGKVTHILDTSTAGGYLYTNSEGGTSRAITPTGHFSIQYKLTGWHKSKLGELYYPSYFTNTGYAIHGEGNGNDAGEVPPFPASHGCVRIPNDSVLRYYSSPWLAVGTSVWIYG
jgi:N-acetylmuramoyl-L-alanine amidase